MNEFLRGGSQTATFRGFNGIQHARNWASKYFGTSYYRGYGYSAEASAGGRGSSAYVTVTKTKTAYTQNVELHNLKKKELRMLKRVFQEAVKSSIDAQSIVSTSSGQNRKRQSPDSDGSPTKKVREVIILD